MKKEIKSPKTKFLFYDLETTGLDPKINEIHQMAFILTEFKNNKFEPLESFEINIKPQKLDEISKEALEICGLKLEDFDDPKYISPKKAMEFLTSKLSNLVDKYNPNDKLMLSGYNIISFDVPFLQEFVKVNNPNLYKYWGGTFHRGIKDVFHDIYSYYAMLSTCDKFPKTMVSYGDNLPKLRTSFKLTTLCEHWKITLDNAHDAFADVTATIACANKMNEILEKYYEKRILNRNKCGNKEKNEK